MVINPNCRQLIFMNYLREKCQYNKNAFIDIIDENGKLIKIYKVDPHHNVKELFENRMMYIPVMVEKSGDERNPYKMIKPLLTDWEKRFPQLERKIKILTGELKRKKSPVSKNLLESRVRVVDRKASSSHRSEMSGRSSSTVGGRKSVVGTGDKVKLGGKSRSKKK